jgi:cobalt-zinc-cadmium efflux system membrane fusion protein
MEEMDDTVVGADTPSGTSRLVRAPVLLSQEQEIVVGQPVRVALAADPDRVLAGTVIAVSSGPTASLGSDPMFATTTVAIEWPSSRVEPRNTQASVEFVTRRTPDALLVPSSAIFMTGGRHVVELLKGDARQTRAVEVGVSTGTETEIRSGLHDGETIVIQR